MRDLNRVGLTRPDSGEAVAAGLLRESETAEYIGMLVRELSEIARRGGLHTMTYLLEMVRLEADQILASNRAGSEAGAADQPGDARRPNAKALRRR